MSTTTSTLTYTSTITLLGKCGSCSLKHRIDADIQVTESAWLNRPHTAYQMLTRGISRDNFTGKYTARCACGHDFWVKPLKAGWSRSHKCGARCTSAIGPSCDCECGGENHGMAHKH